MTIKKQFVDPVLFEKTIYDLTTSIYRIDNIMDVFQQITWELSILGEQHNVYFLKTVNDHYHIFYPTDPTNFYMTIITQLHTHLKEMQQDNEYFRQIKLDALVDQPEELHHAPHTVYALLIQNFGFMLIISEKTQLSIPSLQPKLELLATHLSLALEQMTIRQNYQKFSHVIDQSPATVVITNRHGEIEYVNKKFTSLTGYTFEEAKGNNPRMLRSGKQSVQYYQKMWRTILSGNEWHGEFCNRKKNGELYWEIASVSPLKNSADEVTHFIAVKEDITARKSIEVELQKAKEDAEKASLAKSTFLANMSHELRTPLNGVIGMTDITLNTDLSKSTHENLMLIKKSANGLLDILNDILDFSKIESGNIQLEKISFDFSALIEEIAETIGLLAQKKGIEFILHYDLSLPKTIIADQIKLRQILHNLLGNALKFTEQGEINLLVKNQTPGSNSSCRIEFSITDTGIGIPDNKLEDIFTGFMQADGSITRKYGGTGLGLTITRQLVELMNGKITVKSTVDAGSSFTFVCEFDYDPSEPGEPLNLHQSQVILTLFDNASLEKAVTHYFEYWQSIHIKCNSVNELQTYISEHPNAELIVIIDSAWHTKSSFQSFIKWLEQHKESDGIKFIQLVSHFNKLHQKYDQTFGFGLRKPLLPQKLKLALEYISNTAGRNEYIFSSYQKAKSQKRILCVEDDEITRLMNEKLLKQIGYDVVSAENGLEALKYFATMNFDVAIFDIMMPEMDGITLSRKIRSGEFAFIDPAIPIVAVSAHIQKTDEPNLGSFNLVMQKPLKRDTLIHFIDNLDEQDSNLFSGQADYLENIDFTIIDEIMPAFSVEYQNSFNQIISGLKSGKIDQIENGALHLKKNAEGSNDLRTKELAFRIELACRKDDFADVAKLFPRIFQNDANPISSNKVE